MTDVVCGSTKSVSIYQKLSFSRNRYRDPFRTVRLKESVSYDVRWLDGCLRKYVREG